MFPKYSQIALRDPLWTTSPKKAAKVRTLGCHWEAIGNPLGPVGSLWATFGSPLASQFEEKSVKKHLLEPVTFLVLFFIDF